ncbi:MAG: hypothetical protein WAL34_04280 [Acidobacteriaceae bacterium]
MAHEGVTTEKADKQKRGPKKNSVSSLLRSIADTATKMSQDAALGEQALRTEKRRQEQQGERVLAILQQELALRDQVKRAWHRFSEGDRETLKNFGFWEPRKDRS